MTQSLTDFAKEHGVRYFLVSFTDLFGAQRAKLVPAAAIGAMEADGAGFAGFAAWLDMTPADPDVLAVPDPASAVALPWKPDVAWVAANCTMEGEIVAHAPRNVLRAQIARATDRGLRVKSGVEAEFFLLGADGSDLSDPADTAVKPCYDQQALMRRYEVVAEICDYMLDLGWQPYQNDHEDANGQFEMNWQFDDALTTADRHSFFKFMVKSVAEKHGFRATFMPKPFQNLTGNGCHAHISVWDAAGETNLFADEAGDTGLSDLGRHFLGGIIAHAAALTAISNPTVNSFKRIAAAGTASGATWAPNAISWSGNNRTHMVRVPEGGRFELRLADGAANPYLLQAAIIAAGIDGVDAKADPGERLDFNMYAEPHKAKDVAKLPVNLYDALRLLDENKALRAALGAEFVDAFVKLKTQEWQTYLSKLTDWERETYLDA